MTVEVNGINGPDEPPAGVPEHCASVADACHADCRDDCDADMCGGCACACDDCVDARIAEDEERGEDEPPGVDDVGDVDDGWRSA